MDLAGVVLVGVNAVLGPCIGILLARNIRGQHPEWSLTRWVVILLGVYLLECAALAAGMLVPVFSLALALIWGLIAGSRLRTVEAPDTGMRIVTEFAGYTCITIVTLLTVPCVLLLSSRSILDEAEAVKFGIPEFVPWPANTILGFFLCYVIGVSALKLLITLGTAKVLSRQGGNRAEKERLEV